MAPVDAESNALPEIGVAVISPQGVADPVAPLMELDPTPVELLRALDPVAEIPDVMLEHHLRVSELAGRNAEVRDLTSFREGMSIVTDEAICGNAFLAGDRLDFIEAMVDLLAGGRDTTTTFLIHGDGDESVIWIGEETSQVNIGYRVCNPNDGDAMGEDRFYTLITSIGHAGGGGVTWFAGHLDGGLLLRFHFLRQTEGALYAATVRNPQWSGNGVQYQLCTYENDDCHGLQAWLAVGSK